MVREVEGGWQCSSLLRFKCEGHSCGWEAYCQKRLWRFGLRSWILISILKKLGIPLDAVGLVGGQFYFGYTKKFVFYYLVLAFSFLSLFSFSLQKDILYSLFFKITLLPPFNLEKRPKLSFPPLSFINFHFYKLPSCFFYSYYPSTLKNIVFIPWPIRNLIFLSTCYVSDFCVLAI